MRNLSKKPAQERAPRRKEQQLSYLALSQTPPVSVGLSPFDRSEADII